MYQTITSVFYNKLKIKIKRTALLINYFATIIKNGILLMSC